MKTIVTGGAGFIGSHMIELLLSKGKELIVCLDNFNDYYDPSLKKYRIRELNSDKKDKETKFKFIKGDIAKLESLKECFDQKN